MAFSFLQGQVTPDDPSRVPPMSDGAVLRILDLLLTLDGERLSYRTLDVEQIGSVYETVMGFTVTTLSGPTLAIKAGRNNHTPVFVDLADLLLRRGADRLKALKEDANRAGTLSARQALPITTAGNQAELAAGLAPLVDERGSPRAQVWPAGTPLLQPTDERRRTGSHYTPRDLTNPIVEHALEPAFEQIGEDATPEQVLALKVCDPAMGSGAFLVEACRQLAARLVRAWTRHRGTRPEIPPDEDEDLLARRLVAQRCLYGVDRNPMATDLARLSLWLATLARDHEFTFLDHALKTGDSLVGLTARQIGGLRWQDSQADVAPFDGFIRDRVRQVTEGRRAIRDAPDDVMRAIQEQRHQDVETKTEQVRLLGDATLAAFFGSDKPRVREASRRTLGVSASLAPDQSWPRIVAAAAALRQARHPVRPFHWQVEFPEVFTGATPGFDAVIGNPPYLSGSRTSQEYGAVYFDALLDLFEGARHQCDYVAFFLRKSFDLLRQGGAAGIVCTKTAAQGDTRESGLEQILKRGGTIYRVRRRFVWPGEASVNVSFVHYCKGARPNPVIDLTPCNRISAYLVDGEMDSSPASLASALYFSK